jgi:Fur family peroxide stress response transcriptional regulator
MKIDVSLVEKRIKEFVDLCQQKKIKVTQQRIEVLVEVMRCNDHPDAEKVFAGLRKRMPKISLDTVYRTLWLLTDLGMISTFGFSREKTRFEANLKPHHHFICRKCGLAIDFFSDEMSRLELPQHVHLLGRIDRTQVEVAGICNKCAKSEKK